MVWRREALAPALLNQTEGAAMGVGVRAGFTVIAAFLGGCALSAPSLPSAQYPLASTVASGFHTSAVLANKPAVAGEVEEWDAKGSPDLYGNEVSDAVTRYKLDGAGSLYEVHSPQTELPRLASPIS